MARRSAREKTSSPPGMSTAPIATSRAMVPSSAPTPGVIEQCRTDPGERVRQRRCLPDGAKHRRQHLHRVVHTRDQQEHPLHRDGHLLALLRREQREDRGEDPEAQNRQRRRGEHDERRDDVGVRQVEPEGQRDDHEDDDAAQHRVDDREGADAEEVRDPADRRHERVLDGSLPSLPADRERHLEEHE